MKTILFLNAAGAISGAERSLLTLLDGLDDTRFRPIVAAPEGALLREVGARCIPVIPLPPLPLRRPRTPGDAWRVLRALRHGRRALAQAIALARPDLLHVNSAPAMLLLSTRRTIPVIWHARDLAPLGAWGRVFYRRADRVIAISNVVAEAMRAYAGDGGAKIIRMHPWVDVVRFQPADRHAARATLALPTEAPLIGMVAQFVPWKRHDLFLDALDLLADRPWHAVLAGADFGRDDAYARTLRERIARPPFAGRVSLLPWQEDPVALYSALDMCVLPSRDEPFGRAVIEAMACGVPVVAADEGGPREIIVHGETGLLVPAQPGPLAQALRLLLDDPKLRVQYGHTGRERAVSHFSGEIERQRLGGIYEELLGAEKV